jgi:hypothetical protein
VGGGGKVDDPILTFEQKNCLDIERYEAYCAKSSFLRKKFGSEIVQSKCSKKSGFRDSFRQSDF